MHVVSVLPMPRLCKCQHPSRPWQISVWTSSPNTNGLLSPVTDLRKWYPSPITWPSKMGPKIQWQFRTRYFLFTHSVTMVTTAEALILTHNFYILTERKQRINRKKGRDREKQNKYRHTIVSSICVKSPSIGSINNKLEILFKKCLYWTYTNFYNLNKQLNNYTLAFILC